ncbi:MAG: hypothetical protein HYX94_06850 [Chloroflexi bacterium]|nr:hypothetical protein [Chloroflexota bacterium]
MQLVEADRSLWRSLPRRWATIVMLVVAGAASVPTGLIAGVVVYFLLSLVRRQCNWFPERPAWGFLTIVLVPLNRIVFWLSLAFLLFGLGLQAGSPLHALWAFPLFAGWRLAVMLIERTRLSLL